MKFTLIFISLSSLSRVVQSARPPDPNNLKTLSSTQNGDPEPHIVKTEMDSAKKGLKGNKSPGKDSISAGEIETAGDLGSDVILKFCNKIWKSENYTRR